MIVQKLHNELNESVRKIVKLTGLPQTAVFRYIHTEKPTTNEEVWEHYQNALKKIWKEQDAEIISLATNRIKELLPKAPLYQAIGAFKVARELNLPQNANGGTNPNVNVAVQIVEGPTKKTYNSSSDSKDSDQAQDDVA